MSFVHRYDQDLTRPTRGEAWRDLARRALLPALALWVAVVGVGAVIRGPLDDLPAEDEVVRDLGATRTQTLDTLTGLWSNVGATESIIAVCVVAIGLIWWRTRRWWFAVVPGIAVSLQALIFLTSAVVVGRDRPEADQLDAAPPTSSFPSGHAGAATAFYVTLALVSLRIRRPTLRWLATTACLLVPALVAYARLYRGMHHPTDIAVGVVNGLVCAWLGWRYLRREDRAGRPPAVPGARGDGSR
jgi:membrane-associated phospholipid phosphatase